MNHTTVWETQSITPCDPRHGNRTHLWPFRAAWCSGVYPVLSTQFTFGPLQMLQDKKPDRAHLGTKQGHGKGRASTALTPRWVSDSCGQGQSHGISSASPLPAAFQSELPLPHILQPYTGLPKASSEEHVSIRLNHKRQQTIDPLLIHTPQKNSDGSGKLSFSTARVTRGGCKSKTVGYRVCSWSPL